MILDYDDNRAIVIVTMRDTLSFNIDFVEFQEYIEFKANLIAAKNGMIDSVFFSLASSPSFN